MSSEPKSVAASTSLAHHGTVSPPSAAEQLFLSSLHTGDISAFELASSIRRNVASGIRDRPGRRRSKSPQSTTTAASEYQTAAGDIESQTLDSDEDVAVIEEVDGEDLDTSLEKEGTQQLSRNSVKSKETSATQGSDQDDEATVVIGSTVQISVEGDSNLVGEWKSKSEKEAEEKELVKKSREKDLVKKSSEKDLVKKSSEKDLDKDSSIKELVKDFSEITIAEPKAPETVSPVEADKLPIKENCLIQEQRRLIQEKPSNGSSVDLTKEIEVAASPVNKVNDTKEEEKEKKEEVLSRSLFETTMTKTNDTTPPAAKTTETAATTTTSEENKAEHFEVSQHVYEQAKNLWGFGKGLFLVKTFLNTAETVASKILEVKGIKLTDVDEGLKPKLAELDNGVLDPAIAKVAGLIFPLYQKTEAAIIKPIVIQVVPRILNPLSLIKGGGDSGKSGGDNPSGEKKEGGKTTVVVVDGEKKKTEAEKKTEVVSKTNSSPVPVQ